MAVSPDDVLRIAQLARLRVDASALDSFTAQMNTILDYVALLDEAPTDGVEPLYHVIETGNVLRDDVPRRTLTQDEALSNAPSRDEEFFLVPRVIE